MAAARGTIAGGLSVDDKLTVASTGVEATFHPGLGMVCSSLRLGGEEVLALPVGLDAYGGGMLTAMPLMAPWANRIDGTRYRFAGSDVDMDGAPRVRRDANGLPIHGTLTAHPGWRVERFETLEERAQLTARFDYDSEELLGSFPFPHSIEVEIEAAQGRLRLSTTVRAAKGEVPVAFGWHPFFKLKGARAEWRLHLPERKRLVADARLIPTGSAVEEVAEGEALAGRFFDTGYRLAGPARMGLESSGRRLWLTMSEGYRYAQVFAPLDGAFVCLEPMTAPTNALVTGEHPVAAPGRPFSASLEVQVE